MDSLALLLDTLQDFLARGGYVLWVIFGATLLMWVLIAERYLFLLLVLPKQRQHYIDTWEKRRERGSWHARQVKRYFLSDMHVQLNTSLQVIRMLTILLPMLGLLGTIAGMIQTFDVMAVFGTGNARGMAGGISEALFSTMAGLVGALSGIYLSAHLEHAAEREKQRLADMLAID